MIRKILGKIRKDELIRGSFTLFILINLFNLFGYIQHLIMARMLGPVDYGIFAVLMSFVLIYAIPSEAIQTVISRNTSKLNVGKDFGKMKDMMYKSLKNGAFVSLAVFIVFTILSFTLFSEILKINALLLTIGNLLIFAMFLVPVTRGIIQGRKKFSALGWTMFLEAILKVGLSAIFVYIGWRVYGAIIGVIVAVIAVLALSFAFIREIVSARREKVESGGLYFGNLNIWLAVAAVFIFFSSDIIIAKAVFEPELAGKYAVLSMIGKMIFYGTSGISKVMFPISSQRFEEKKKASDVFKKSLIITLMLCIAAVIITGLFPTLVIKTLFGTTYTDVYYALLYVIIAFSLLSISNLFILYGISKNRFTKRSSLPFILLFAAEIILLGFFSENSITKFAIYFIIINIMILLWSAYIATAKRKAEQQR